MRPAFRSPICAASMASSDASIYKWKAALTMAISAQRPGASLIHHSDRGVQYASGDYRKVTQSASFQVSMSRKADCYDNAPMEGFFHTLKTELVQHRRYANTRGSQT